ncbi:unnamed protein product [Onchocerca ochengi]|uniref:Breast cancer type 1 susceptibility protein homolog n=1 Tax=Onchocerca ochengi TaxID=42157 RepID=A0A182EBF6_ONCOC|nr:unnamed protein product [Onchocerca ochengi]
MQFLQSTRPKKAVVEHSIRLSFHNELPQSEASGSPKTTVKHRPGSVMIPDQTQSGVIHSKDLFPSKYVPKLTREAHITTVGKSPIESEKLIEDKTQTSMPSMDFTQSITTSEEYDDKQFSRTLTESNTEDYKQKKTKNSFLNLERDKASTETSILNVTMNQGSVVSQNNSKQQTKVKESESTR